MKFKWRVRWPWWWNLVHDWSLTVARFWALSSGVHVVNLRSKQYILIFSALKNICKSTFSTFQHVRFQFISIILSVIISMILIDRRLTTIISEGSRTRHSFCRRALPPARFPKLKEKLSSDWDPTIMGGESNYHGRCWVDGLYTHFTRFTADCMFIIIVIATMFECLEQ